jgi:hypothetical protein
MLRFASKGTATTAALSFRPSCACLPASVGPASLNRRSSAVGAAPSKVSPAMVKVATPTQHNTLTLSGGFRTTPMLLIHPLIARVVAGVAMVVVQSLWDAHKAEAARLARQYGSQAQQAKLQLTHTESLAILGMDQTLKAPLKGKDAEAATAHFKALFAKAQAVDSPYLQGKFSGAYRVLVDPVWDAEEVKKAQEEQDQH